MRILQIHNFYAIPGGECGVIEAEKSLLESHGHEVLRFTRTSRTLAEASFFEKVYDFAHIPDNARVARDLTHLLKQAAPDVAHVHNVFPLLSPSIYRALRRCNVPIVQTVHNFRFQCPAGTLFRRGRVCELCSAKGFRQAVRYRCVRGSLATSVQYARAVSRMWHEKLLTDCIDRFIALNEFSKRKLTDAGIPREKVEVCGNFAASIAGQVTEKEPFVLYLGRLSAEKGLATLITAARKLRSGRIKIAGTGPLEGEMRAAAAELSNIEFLGYVDGSAKRKLISQASAMVMPSEWFENFPISIVESMSLGTPVIASNIGGLPEMVEHGRSGLLFEPGDADMLAAHIATMHEDRHAVADLARGALARAQVQFSPQRHMAELERIYRDCVSGWDARPEERQA